MANVRYMGGSSATLGTKNITENGIYNASSDDLDGYSSVNVDVPEPSGSVNLQYTSNGTYMDVDVEDYETANITVNVPSQTIPTQEKDIIATTSQQVVTPDGGYLLNRVTVDPQRHMNTYTPATDTSNNDMGIIHNYRYVDTSGMITPTGSMTVNIDSNGTYTEDVTSKTSVDIEVNVPVSGDLGTKTIITNGTYQALDDNLDGYSEVTVNVPRNATLGIKTITNNGNYYATTDGYDGFSRVDVNVAGATLQTSKSVTATTSQQTVTPDVGYDGMEQVIVNPQVHTQTYSPADNTAANDMGANNNYRYVDTSGMYTPTSITPSNSSPVALSANTPVNPTANGYAIESYSLANPAEGTRMTGGNFYKATDNGLIIDDIETLAAGSGTDDTIVDGKNYHAVGSGIAIQGFTNLTPSNSSPVSLSSGNYYKPTASGYAISSYSDVAPSNANPPSISNGGIYKINTRNGYLISTVNIVVPSDSNPPLLSNDNSWYRLNGASGYLYSTIQKFKTGTISAPTSGVNHTINCGFQPTKIFVYVYESSTKYYTDTYDSNLDATYQFMGYKTSSTATASRFSINATNNGIISGVTSTGFSWRGWQTFPTLYYVAIG